MIPTPKRRWFRWSLRTMFVVVTVGLCGCGKWPPIVNSKADIDRLPISTQRVRARALSDDDIQALARLTELTDLDFWGGWKSVDAPITDRGLAKLAVIRLPKLEELSLGVCKNISNNGLAHVARIDTVTTLHLPNCPKITDDGLSHLINMNNLTALTLEGCPGITDRGLQILEQKKDWQLIRLGGCANITPAGIARLKAALPNAEIDLRPE